jgi:hypothetical protein
VPDTAACAGKEQRATRLVTYRHGLSLPHG